MMKTKDSLFKIVGDKLKDLFEPKDDKDTISEELKIVNNSH